MTGTLWIQWESHRMEADAAGPHGDGNRYGNAAIAVPPVAKQSVSNFSFESHSHDCVS